MKGESLVNLTKTTPKMDMSCGQPQKSLKSLPRSFPENEFGVFSL